MNLFPLPDNQNFVYGIDNWFSVNLCVKNLQWKLSWSSPFENWKYKEDLIRYSTEYISLLCCCASKGAVLSYTAGKPSLSSDTTSKFLPDLCFIVQYRLFHFSIRHFRELKIYGSSFENQNHLPYDEVQKIPGCQFMFLFVNLFLFLSVWAERGRLKRGSTFKGTVSPD